MRVKIVALISKFGLRGSPQPCNVNVAGARLSRTGDIAPSPAVSLGCKVKDKNILLVQQHFRLISSSLEKMNGTSQAIAQFLQLVHQSEELQQTLHLYTHKSIFHQEPLQPTLVPSADPHWQSSSAHHPE